MKRKKQWLLIGTAVVAVALCVTVMLHILLKPRKSEHSQIKVESKLPFGDYLPTAENPLIRVVLKTNGFSGIFHNEVQINTGNNKTTKITPDDPRFQNGSIRIEPETKGGRIIISSLHRGYGVPSYRGVLELYKTAEGIVIVNEVPVEEYLYAVVPSEMPSSYASEALKCQAICARSYAYCQMSAFAYPQYNAHVDDSVSFQVYGNSKEKDSTTEAVNLTAGKKLWFQNQVVKTYYYSTSCGHSTSVEAWGTTLSKNNQYLKGVKICNGKGEDYERTYPWYRWTATIPKGTLSNLIELNTETEIGTLKELSITKTGIGGVALQITAKGTKGSVTVNTENKIRSALGGTGYSIVRQDGTKINSTKLLPSAFFTIEKQGDNFILKGGGYGHGIGMSQNGANEMAKSGKTHEEILTFFYPGTEVK